MSALFEEKVSVLGPRLMKDLGLTAAQASGVFGSLGHESGGFRYYQEIHPIAGRGGAGFCQWTGPRRRLFEAFCASQGLDPRSDEGSYRYLVHELQGSERASLDALKRTKDVQGAATSFCQTFERPGIVSMASRLAYANQAAVILRDAKPVPAYPTAVAIPAPAGGIWAWLKSKVSHA